MKLKLKLNEWNEKLNEKLNFFEYSEFLRDLKFEFRSFKSFNVEDFKEFQ